MIGIGIITLLVYIAMIIVLNIVIKRSMGESMLWACLVMLLIGGVFGGQNVVTLNATATTSAMCAVCFMAMRSIGIPALTAAVAFINLVSNQSCIPPNSAPIYISCGIANVEEPVKIFKDLVFYYALPQVVIVLLVMFQIIPIIGA